MDVNAITGSPRAVTTGIERSQRRCGDRIADLNKVERLALDDCVAVERHRPHGDALV
jgi:hypothetical protein